MNCIKYWPHKQISTSFIITDTDTDTDLMWNTDVFSICSLTLPYSESIKVAIPVSIAPASENAEIHSFNALEHTFSPSSLQRNKEHATTDL